VEFVVGHLPDHAVLALPDRRHAVACRRVRGGVSVEHVVCDVESAPDVPVGELRAVARVPDSVVRFVELESEVVDDGVPEPVQPRGVDTLDSRHRPSVELLEVVDAVLLHERVNVTPLDERLVWLVDDLASLPECLCHG
jgi:hypothetical protein